MAHPSFYYVEVDVTEVQSTRRGIAVYHVRRPLRALLEMDHRILLDARTWCPLVKRQMVVRIGSLVAALHSRGVIHMSINPSCINYCSTTDCLQLCNATLYQAAQAYQPLRFLPELSRYAPPEVLNCDAFYWSMKADVYSWACMAYAVFIGNAVFASLPPVQCIPIIATEGHTRLTQPSGMQNDLWEVIQSCWNSDPNRRPSMASIVTRLGGEP